VPRLLLDWRVSGFLDIFVSGCNWSIAAATLKSVSKRTYGRGFQQGQGGSRVGILFELGPSIEQLIVLHLQTSCSTSIDCSPVKDIG